ncbi:hypothetical protein ACKFKG_03220 [Phormidesmis sp. 146-35]
MKLDQVLFSKANRTLHMSPLQVMVAIAVVMAGVSLYISQERMFYGWDSTAYVDLIDQKLTALKESPLLAVAKTWLSSSQDYSDYPTLLLLPFRGLFGESRLTYILSTAFVYLLPLALTLSTIANQLLPKHRRLASWSSLVVTFTTPVFWIPTLRGYVDAGGTLLIALSVLTYLRDPKLQQRWQVLVIGSLLGFVPLFRRHFLYASLVFFAAMIVQALLDGLQDWRSTSPQTTQALIKRLRQIGFTAIVSLMTILLLGLPFVMRLLQTNFTSLYASYEFPLQESLQAYGNLYGWIAVLGAALGYAVGWKMQILARPAMTFVATFYSLTFLLWVTKVKQIGVHYTSHFTPLIVLGWVALVVSMVLTLRRRSRLFMLTGSALYLSLNVYFGFMPAPTETLTSISPILGWGTNLSRLFAANSPPLRQPDYDELVRLVKELKILAPNQEAIYVGGAAAEFNRSVLKNGDSIVHQQSSLNFLPTEDIDSRDRYPLERLLQADYVVVTDPFKHHLLAAEQDIVKVVTDIFQERWKFSQDFVKLPAEFRLTDGAKVSLYRRIKPTTLPTAIATLKQLQQTINPPPGGQANWVMLDQRPGHIAWGKAGNYQIRSDRKHPTESGTFLYINSLEQSQAKVTGKIANPGSQCPGTELRLDVINAQGQTLNTVKTTHLPGTADNFQLTASTPPSTYLQLRLSHLAPLPVVKQQCQLRLSHLTLAATSQ